ncbi:putative metal-dependent hydrolase [Dirofilaria immitis]
MYGWVKYKRDAHIGVRQSENLNKYVAVIHKTYAIRTSLYYFHHWNRLLKLSQLDKIGRIGLNELLKFPQAFIRMLKVLPDILSQKNGTKSRIFYCVLL